MIVHKVRGKHRLRKSSILDRISIDPTILNMDSVVTDLEVRERSDVDECIFLHFVESWSKKLETAKVPKNKDIHFPCKVNDVRFPTSLEADGSDAIHPDPDYSAW